jgi:hypothetical protein
LNVCVHTREDSINYPTIYHPLKFEMTISIRILILIVTLDN